MLSFLEEMQKSRLSMTDTLGLEAGLILNGVVFILSLKMMSTKGPQLTELFSKQTNILNLLRVQQKQMDYIASGIIKNSAFAFTFG